MKFHNDFLSKLTIVLNNGTTTVYHEYKSTQVSPELTYGLTDNIDFQYTQLYLMNQSEASSWEHLGDTSLLLGFQVLSNDVKNTLPNLRITLEKVIPTGVYDNLSENYDVILGTWFTVTGKNTPLICRLCFRIQHLLVAHGIRVSITSF